jgi:hypothetical protein
MDPRIREDVAQRSATPAPSPSFLRRQESIPSCAFPSKSLLSTCSTSMTAVTTITTSKIKKLISQKYQTNQANR